MASARESGDTSAGGPPAGRRILVLSFDPLTESMPGPAIRAWNLAGQLAADHDVILAGTAGVTRSHPAMEVTAAEGGRLAELVGWADAVFAPTSVVRRHPEVSGSDRPLCIDMYIPTHLENLEGLDAPGSQEHAAAVAHQVSVLNDDLQRGDFFLCASERQRDFWLGALGSLGRLNPATYGSDATLRRLIDVVPFGLDPGRPPDAARAGGTLRSVFPGIGPSDPVLIWGGGVYNWFDPSSVVAAVDILRSTRPGIRLVFLGMRNPNPAIPEMRVAREVRELSARLGLTDQYVFFNDGWVPYDERAAYLVDADIGISTHLDHVETRFSFRTRVLDYLWAGLPMVLTGGDTISEEIAAAGIGITVPPGDPAAIADAVGRLIDHPPSRQSVGDFGTRYTWPSVAGPLTRWAADPRRAADLAGRARAAAAPAGPEGRPGGRPPLTPRRLAGAARRRMGRALATGARRLGT